MSELYIDDAVKYDVSKAMETYRWYFAQHGDPFEGECRAREFLKQCLSFIDRVEREPYSFPPFHLYPFDGFDSDYRSYKIDWFIALYTIDNEVPHIWRLVNARSDFGRIHRR